MIHCIAHRPARELTNGLAPRADIGTDGLIFTG